MTFSKQTVFALISLFSIAIGAYYSNLHSTHTGQTKIPLRKLSVYEEAMKAQYFSSALSLKQIHPSNNVDSQKAFENQDSINSFKLLNSYNEQFKNEQSYLGDNLKNLENHHYILLNKMRNEGITIDSVTNLRPRLKIIVSFYLNLKPYELTSYDLDGLKLSNQEWHALKNFSESKDFELLLKRGRLSSDYIIGLSH